MIPRIAYGNALCVLFVAICHQSIVSCYVTAPRGVLPIHKQKAYLESLTSDILNSEIGSLPPEQLRDTIPRLVDAWACHPVTPELGFLNNNGNKSANNDKKNKDRDKKKKKLVSSSASNSAKHPTLQYSLTIEKLLKRLVDESYSSPELKESAVSTEVYNALLTSWVRAATERCTDVQVAIASAIRATTILVQMQELYEDRGTTQPNELSFRTVLSAWEGAATLAVSSSADSSQMYDVVSHLHSILEWMIDLYMDEKNFELHNIVYDREVFHSIMALMGNTLVTKYAGHRSVEHCERMLRKMEYLDKFARNRSKLSKRNAGRSYTSTISPDTTTYNLVLQAWAKAADHHSTVDSDALNREVVANRAYQILSHMERLPHIEPNKRSYATVIHLLAKSGSKEHAMKARKIINSMEQRFLQSQGSRADFLPDTMCYNLVINAVAKSKELHGIPHLAADLLERMKKIYEDYNVGVCKPDVFTYSSVISAYAFVLGSKSMKHKSFTMAMNLWEDLKSNPSLGSANQVTYGALLRACTLLPSDSNEREEAVRKIFEECRDSGYVNSRVVDQLKAAASRALYQELMSCHSTKKELPFDWRRKLQDPSGRDR